MIHAPASNGSFRSDQELGRLIEEITARRQTGVPIDIERYVSNYPEYSEQLRQLLPALDLLAGMSGEGFSWPDFGRSMEGTSGLLGDFRIVREVGRGGMGIVYEAEQLSLGRRVALKVLPFAATLDPNQLQRFRHEARAAAGLHHEHIVPVYAVGCERGIHYYAMQFIDGDTLARLIPGPGRPPSDFRNVARLIATAADALDYAHRLGLVHRDVKPANLLVDAGGKLWVTDFGLARFGSDTGLTGSNGVVGTLRYMPPEQAFVRHGLVDHRADIYGLGATLYELLTGRPAFGESNRVDLFYAIATDEPTPPRHLDRSIPQELETIALKCLSKDPSDRYATATELADDLRRWLNGRPVHARPLPARKRVVRWAGRHRTAVMTAVALIVFVSIGTTIASIKMMHARDRETLQRQRADTNWRNAFDALDRICLDLAEERLPKQAPSTSAEQNLVTQLLAYYDAFVTENGSDPCVRYEAARASLRIGDLCYRLDRSPEALQAYRQAESRARDLADEFPSDERYRRILAASLGQIAVINVFGVIDEYPTRFIDAEAAALESVALRNQLGDRQERARAQNVLGLVLSALIRPDEAEVAYKQAMIVHEELVRMSPDVRVYRSDLAACLVNLAVLRWKANQSAEAADYARQAMVLWKQLVDDTPREPFYRRWLAKSCIILCAVGSGDREEDERLGRRSIDLHQALVAEFPGVPTHRYELAISWNWLGRHRMKAQRYSEASTAFGESLALLNRLTAEFPNRPDYPGSAGDTLANYSQMARDRGDKVEGRRLWQEALKNYRTAREIDPLADRYREKIRREFGTVPEPLGGRTGLHTNSPDRLE
jgi:tetratricopeptide (TPR) repeat protein